MNVYGAAEVTKSRLESERHRVQCCHDNSICSFLTCSVCLLMMGSEYEWAFGEGSNSQLVRGPQIEF